MTSAQNPLTPEPVSLGRWTSNLDTPARALAIGAHPDDVDFGCGATLAKWAAAGCEVSVLVCTDGSKGTWDPMADEAQLITTRQLQQRAAAAPLGAAGDVVLAPRDATTYSETKEELRSRAGEGYDELVADGSRIPILRMAETMIAALNELPTHIDG